MKTMILAGAAALGLGIGIAHAGDGDGASAPTLFTQLTGQQPVPNGLPRTGSLPAMPSRQIHTFATGHSTGTWLFPPSEGVGG